MYEKLQKLWVEETGLKIGDKVKVLRKFENHELGLLIPWNPEMSATIGEVGKVNYIYANCIGVNVGEDYWSYPFMVLEKVEEKKPDVPDTDRYVLFLSSDDEWEIGFYCSEFRSWKIKGSSIYHLGLAEGEVLKWQELPSKED